MNPGNNEPRHGLGAGGRESSAVAAAPSLAHASDTAKAETDETAAVQDLWARAETAWAMSDFPEYGSPEWDALDDSNPAKLAAMLSAAEKWRRL